jgi:hypothetical protein
MNPSDSPAATTPRRSYGKWIAAGLVILVTPMLLLGVAAWSMMTLDSDAALLRREVMTATGSDWHTKVQMDVGSVTLGTIRTALRFVHHKDMDDARLALSAVRSASVGVYERSDSNRDVSTEKLFGRTDKLMRARGWTRLVGVAQGKQSVLVYTSDRDHGDRMDLCLAVVDGKELVVVSTRVDAAELMKLVEKHAPGDFKGKIKLANLNF